LEGLEKFKSYISLILVSMLYEHSAGAVVFRKVDSDVKYLLLHYFAGHWDFPKGNIEKGETIEETVRREIFEETGLNDIRIIPGFKERIIYFYRREGGLVKKDVVYLLAEAFSSRVRLSYEHKGYGWFSMEDALTTLTYDSSKAVLEKAASFLRKHTSLTDFSKTS